jgi:hypothetical protein
MTSSNLKLFPEVQEDLVEMENAGIPARYQARFLDYKLKHKFNILPGALAAANSGNLLLSADPCDSDLMKEMQSHPTDPIYFVAFSAGDELNSAWLFEEGMRRVLPVRPHPDAHKERRSPADCLVQYQQLSGIQPTHFSKSGDTMTPSGHDFQILAWMSATALQRLIQYPELQLQDETYNVILA